jgi:predicted alpha/beta-fold hydrolase
LNQSWIGRSLDQSITRQLKLLAARLAAYHPAAIDLEIVERIHNIWTFDEELVIGKLGFDSVEAYYAASSPLYQLASFQKPTLILYAADDPMFDPTLVSELESACAQNPAIELLLTAHGGHVGYLSSKASQRQSKDSDPWWAWNRILDWFNRQS